ncbi:MAG: hypothetical protein HYW65_01155 [Candidatus Liptonbacteria bacterium]|nr:hypothetical protein [Candidatus Liptonbacteria bacterium]MBI3114522.1 hypothetical protein [Candidatus Harrisonbacteria bacterium]
MKAVFGTLVMCAFISMAVFGAFALLQHTDNHQIGCLARTAAGGNACPGVAGSAEAAAFHLSVLKSFSAAYVAAWAGAALLAMAVIGIVARAAFEAPSLYVYVPLRAARAQAPHKVRFARWLALCERRIPSLA